MVRKIIVVSLFSLFLGIGNGFCGAPDHRISDNDGDVLNINSDGTVPVTIAGGSVNGTFNVTNLVVGNQSSGLFNVGTSPGQGLLTVATGGNVGIGTTNPTATLDILGNMKLNYADLRSLENNKPQVGAIYFDKNEASTRIYHTLFNNISTSDFSIHARILVPNTLPAASYGIVSLSSSNSNPATTSALRTFIDINGALNLRFVGPGSTSDIRNFLVPSFTANYQNKTVDVVFTRSTTNNATTISIDGINQTQSTSTSGTDPTAALNIISNFATIGISSNTQIYADRIYKARLYNRVLSQSEVISLFEHGIAVNDQWGNLTNLTSGTITNTKRYKIMSYVAGDDFTNVGASGNVTGVEFISNGTTPAVWTQGSILNQIGCILDSDLENADPAKSLVVQDRSGNNLDGVATATGLTQIKPLIQINPTTVNLGGGLITGSGGTSGIAVDSTGKVGIGNTSPLAKLDVRGASVAGAGFALRVQDSTPTDRLVVQDSGNVGIGTTNPMMTLSLKTTGTATGQGLFINATTTNDAAQIILKAANTATCYRLFIGSTGTVTTSAVACPAN